MRVGLLTKEMTDTMRPINYRPLNVVMCLGVLGAAVLGAARLSVASASEPAAMAAIPSTRIADHANGSAKFGTAVVRQTTSITCGSGRILVNPEVSLTFFGNGWTGTSQSPSSSQLVASTLETLNGPYFSKLNQYGNSTYGYAGLGRMVPRVALSTSFTGSTFKDQDVINALTAEMDAGTVPLPTAGIDMVYAVVVPTGVTSADHATTCDGSPGACVGYHGMATYAKNNQTFYWAWSTSDGTMTGGNSAPRILSHEIVETVTDPELNACTGTGGEIGDPCVNDVETQAGHALQAYWSQSDGKCVLPTGWTDVYQYNGTPDSWTKILTGTVRQIYAGGAGLIATDTSDNLNEYSGTPGTWNQIGGSAAMYAVGDSGIMGIGPDDALYIYNGTPLSWTQVPSLVGFTGVYAGGILAMSEWNGAAYQYNGPGNAFTSLTSGGPNDQYVANAYALAALSWDHQST
jgi:hypothetical protein